MRSTALRIRPTPTPLAIEPVPLTLGELGIPAGTRLELLAERRSRDPCAPDPVHPADWVERIDADLDGDGVADVVRLRPGPVINPGRGLIEMAVEFGDGRVHHRLGLALTDQRGQVRPVRIDGTNQDVILFSNPEPQLDVQVLPASWVLGMQDCRVMIVANAGSEGKRWCRSGTADQVRIDLHGSRLRVRDADVDELAVVLSGCDPDDAGQP